MGTLKTVESTLTRVKSTLKAVESTLKRVESTLTRVKSTLKAVESTLKRVESTLKTVESTLKRAKSTLKRQQPLFRRDSRGSQEDSVVVSLCGRIVPDGKDSVTIGVDSSSTILIRHYWEERSKPFIKKYVANSVYFCGPCCNIN